MASHYKYATASFETYSRKSRCTKKGCDLQRTARLGSIFFISMITLYQGLHFIDHLHLSSSYQPWDVFLLLSMGCNIFFLYIILGHIGKLPIYISYQNTKKILYIVAFIFLLTSIGTLFSDDFIQQYVLSLVTFLVAYFVFLLALDGEHLYTR